MLVLGVVVGFVAMAVLSFILLPGPIIAGFIAGVVAGGEAGRGVLTGFLTGIIGVLISFFFFLSGVISGLVGRAFGHLAHLLAGIGILASSLVNAFLGAAGGF